MTVIPADIQQAIIRAEAALMKCNGHSASMRTRCAACDWPAAAREAQAAAAAFEAYLDAIQDVYRAMAKG